MDDLSDLVWKSTGTTRASAPTQNASTPLNQIPVNNYVSSLKPSDPRLGGNRSVSPSYQNMGRTSPSGHSGLAPPSYTPPKPNQPLTNSTSTSTSAFSSSPGFTATSSTSTSTANNISSKQPMMTSNLYTSTPPANTTPKSSDPFANLINLGSTSSKSNSTQATLSSQTYSDYNITSVPSNTLNANLQKHTVIPSNWGNKTTSPSNISHGPNQSPSNKQSSGNSNKVNDFRELLGGTSLGSNNKSITPQNLNSTTLDSLHVVETSSPILHQNLSSTANTGSIMTNNSDTWDLDYFTKPQVHSSASVSKTGNTLPSQFSASGTGNGDDPFDIAYLSKTTLENPLKSSVNPAITSSIPTSEVTIGTWSHTPATSEVSEIESQGNSELKSLSDPHELEASKENDKMDAAICQIVEMGFSVNQAKDALKDSSGDVRLAIDAIISGKNYGNKEKREKIQSYDDNDNDAKDSDLHKVADEFYSDRDWDAEDDNSWADPEKSRHYSKDTSNYNKEKIIAAASGIGLSVLSKASAAFSIGKKKLAAAVEVAKEGVGEKGTVGIAVRKALASRPTSAQNNINKKMDYWTDNPGRFRDNDEDEDMAKIKIDRKEIDSRADSPRISDVNVGKNDQTKTDEKKKESSKTELMKHEFSKKDESLSTVTSTETQKNIQKSSNDGFISTTIQGSFPIVKKKEIPEVWASPEQIQNSNEQREKGNMYFKQGQFSDAESCYTTSINVLPSGHRLLITLYNNRAAARLKIGDNKGAVEDCTMVQRVDNSDVKSLLKRATAYEYLEKWDLARSDYETLLILDSSNKMASLGLNRCEKGLKMMAPSKDVKDVTDGKSMLDNNPISQSKENSMNSTTVPFPTDYSASSSKTTSQLNNFTFEDMSNSSTITTVK